MNGQNWMRLAALVATMTLVSAGATNLAFAGSETDQLACYKVKDVSKLALGNSAEILTLFLTTENCTIKKAGEVCAPTRINNADDPRALPSAAYYLCYKAKCSNDDFVPDLTGNTQFGEHDLTFGKIKRICSPIQFDPI